MVIVSDAVYDPENISGNTFGNKIPHSGGLSA